jgi:uncharacterized protein YuzE
MKIEYDKSVDAAYIFLSDMGTKVKKTYLCNPKEVNGMINLDFDNDGHLVGIEVMDASKKLPKEIIESAN